MSSFARIPGGPVYYFPRMAPKTDKFTNTPTEIDSYVEILPSQLYFAVLKTSHATKLKNNAETLFFTTDHELIYQNYYCDFGPLNLSCVYKYCMKLNKYLDYAKNSKKVVYYTCNNPEKKANAACLMGCFCVIYLQNNAKNVWKILQNIGTFKPFLDASQYPCGFTLKILDVLQALQKATLYNFFDFADFDINEYDLYDKIQFGDMNWLVPRKFLAFIGPNNNGAGHPPEFYIRYFLKNDIKTVIRLNAVSYDSRIFTNIGIQHYDLIYPDGAVPPRNILFKFLAISEMAPAAVAVHCKAGLGRTGSLIGAYLVKHYHMTAREAIGWMRLCRPGSVIGQQQIWLEKIESWLWRIGTQYRMQKFGSPDRIPRHKYGIYSKRWQSERNKLISAARWNLQSTFTKSRLNELKMNQLSTDSIGPPPAALNSSFSGISKMLESLHGTEDDSQDITYFKCPKISLWNGKISQGDRLNEKKFAWR